MNDGTIPTSGSGKPEVRPARLTLSAPVYDLIVFVCLALVGVVFVYGAFDLGDPKKAVDAGTVPMIAGGLLIVLTVWGAVQSMMRIKSPTELVTERPFQVLLAMVLVLIFPPTIEVIGYYLTAVIWVPVFAWLAGARSWITCILVGAAVLAMARFVFEMVLGTPLP